MFRFAIIFLILVFQYHTSISQCTADAGGDTTVCVINNYDTLSLGGSPTATGGSGNYSYTWTAYLELSPTLKFYASDFLDDTTIANPRLVEPFFGGLTYYVTVMDSSGNTCYDSIRVEYCNLVVSLIDLMEFICPGDTVNLGTTGNTYCHPLSYEWFPKYNISDPFSPNPKAWPDTTTYYFAVVTDSLGCQWTDEINEIFVCPSSLETSNAGLELNVYPNPFDEEIIIEINSGNVVLKSLSLLSESGQILSQIKPYSSEFKLDTKILSSGMYILVLETEDQIERRKIFKR